MESNNSDARQLNNPTLLEKVKEVTAELIEHPEAKKAYNLAKQLEVKIVELKILNPEFFSQYQALIIRLKIVALPMLSDEEVLEIIQKNFLNAMEVNVGLENRLIAKFFSLPLIPRDELRKKLYLTLKDNREKIGLWSIKEWLADYDNFADPKKRTNVSSVEYLTQKREAHALSEKEKEALRKLFHLYDNLFLVTPVITEPLLSETVAKATGRALRKEVRPAPSRPAVPPPSSVAEAPPFTPPPARPTYPPQPERAPTISQPTPPQFKPDTYKEPVGHEDITGPPGARKVEPRIDGNIVDLSDRSHTDEKQI